MPDPSIARTSPIPAHIGPSDPFHPTDDIELLTHTPSGVHVERQAYADGYIYEYQVPNGVSIYPDIPHLATPLFRGRLLRTFFDGECNFITVWMTRLPAVDFTGTPVDEYETLHEEEHLVVSRLRFENGEDGWIYRVQSQLGRPWPRLPCLAPTLTAPLVALDRTDMDVIVRYWVSDITTSAEAPAGLKAGGVGWTKIRDSRSGSSRTFRRYSKSTATSSPVTNESDTAPSARA